MKISIDPVIPGIQGTAEQGDSRDTIKRGENKVNFTRSLGDCPAVLDTRKCITSFHSQAYIDVTF